jgi:hypothetical protein
MEPRSVRSDARAERAWHNSVRRVAHYPHRLCRSLFTRRRSELRGVRSEWNGSRSPKRAPRNANRERLSVFAGRRSSLVFPLSEEFERRFGLEGALFEGSHRRSANRGGLLERRAPRSMKREALSSLRPRVSSQREMLHSNRARRCSNRETLFLRAKPLEDEKVCREGPTSVPRPRSVVPGAA